MKTIKKIKMKTLKLIGMAFAAIVLSATFVACSDDDDNNGGSSSKGKRLVSLSFDETNGTISYPDVWNVTYDSNGNVLSITSEDSYSYYYTWDSDKLYEQFVRPYYNELDNGTFNIKNGLVTNYVYNDRDIDVSYEYDTLGHLISRKGNKENVSFIWENGIPVKQVIEDSNIERSFEYNGQTCNGYNPMMLWDDDGFDITYDDDDAFFKFTNPEMFGFKVNQLPYMVDNNGSIRTFTYEFDKDNYITKCTINLGGIWKEVYCFEWE